MIIDILDGLPDPEGWVESLGRPVAGPPVPSNSSANTDFCLARAQARVREDFACLKRRVASTALTRP